MSQIQKILAGGRISIPRWKNWKTGEYVLVSDDEVLCGVLYCKNERNK